MFLSFVTAAGGEHLVGRPQEVAALDGLLERAAAGVGGAVLIEGTAGLGKSRLLAEAATRARAQEIRVLAARGVGAERHYPFAVALQLFESLLGGADPQRSRLLAGAAGLSAPLFSGGFADAPGRSPFPWLHGLYWLTVNVSHSGPVLLCVDDAQWSDELSLRFVQYLLHRIEELPIAVVIAARPGVALPQEDVLSTLRADLAPTRLLLAPLRDAEVAEVVREQLPEAQPAFCAACAQVTGGNPFYVREVLRSVGEEHLRPTAAQAERLRDLGFAAVNRAALFRLGRLGADATALARALSVLGDGSPLRLVARLAGLDFERAADAADALAAEDLVRAGTTLSFAHPLIGQLVYDDLPTVRGALAHKRAAHLLAGENASPESVASHLLFAPAAGDDWVVQQLCAGARAARTKAAPDVAVRLLDRALHEPPLAQRRADVLAALGAAEATVGMPAALAHLQASLDLRAELTERVDARRELAHAQAALGRRRAAAENLEIALDELGEQTGEVADGLLGDYLANAAFEPGLRQRSFVRADRLGSSPGASTAAERAVLAALAMRSGQDGEPVAQTAELADRAWGDGRLLAEQGADGPGWLMTVWAHALAAQHQRTTELAGAAMAAAQHAGLLDAFATASYFSAWGRAGMGRLADAQADVEQAVQSRELGWRRYLVAALALKATLLVARGELEAADESLTLAADFDEGGGIEVPWRMHAVGRLAMARQDPAGALHSFLAAGAFLGERLGVVDHTVLPWRTDAAHAALLAGEPERGYPLLEHELRLARRSGAAGALGRVLRVQGLLEGGDHGVELLRQAGTCSASGGELFEQACALTELGSALRRRGDRLACRRPLTEALDLATRCGATPLARVASDELAASGARRPSRPTSGPDSLTPSERRIAEHARAGLTNTQIAQALFVTPKTVEYHLRHVYEKLGVSGRHQLRAQAGGSRR